MLDRGATGATLERPAAGTVYVSITGLKLKRPWHVLRFYRHAIPCFRQARRADGNLRTEAQTIDGVRHTLTVWRDKAAMRAFLYSGAHCRAIAAFRSFATGKTFGFETDRVPAWDDVHALWQARGREYGQPRTDKGAVSGLS